MVLYRIRIHHIQGTSLPMSCAYAAETASPVGLCFASVLKFTVWPTTVFSSSYILSTVLFYSTEILQYGCLHCIRTYGASCWKLILLLSWQPWYNVHCTLYTVSCTLYSVRTSYSLDIIYSVHCKLYNVQCMYILQSWYNVLCIVCSPTKMNVLPPFPSWCIRCSVWDSDVVFENQI